LTVLVPPVVQFMSETDLLLEHETTLLTNKGRKRSSAHHNHQSSTYSLSNLLSNAQNRRLEMSGNIDQSIFGPNDESTASYIDQIRTTANPDLSNMADKSQGVNFENIIFL